MLRVLHCDVSWCNWNPGSNLKFHSVVETKPPSPLEPRAKTAQRANPGKNKEDKYIEYILNSN